MYLKCQSYSYISLMDYNKNTFDETVCFLSNRISKPYTHVRFSLDIEKYYRIKDNERK
jgi:hypothetical protein